MDEESMGGAGGAGMAKESANNSSGGMDDRAMP
jgi:hypothetical protein